ncbi:TaqI-like C-terminal specificity domain-containing protein, partial [Microcoleus anatoxicus]
NYLSQYQEKLTPGTGRKAGTYKWYEIQDNVAYWQEFEQPKILYQEIATYQAFAWDESGAYSNNKTFLIPNSSFYLLSLLNSKIVWFFLSNITSKLQGGAYAMQTPYISQIPIPNAQPQEKLAIETLVNYIIYLTAELKDIPSHGEKMVATAEDKLMLSYFEQVVDALVMELYLPEELHSDDKYFMSHVLSENLPAFDTIKGDKMPVLRQIFKRLFDSEHPIRVNIYFLNSLEVVRIIRGLG